MGRPNGLSGSQVAEVRTFTGVIVADNASLVDANYPLDQALTCRGYQTIWVGVEIAGGSAPTATLEILVRDEDALDGKRWKKLLVGSPDGVTAAAAASQKTPALDGTAFFEVRVEGRVVFFRIDAVTNPGSTTGIKILAIPGKPRSDLNRYT